MVAFWTQDPNTIDVIFRQSRLMRDKWDEKHRADGTTYGQMTIEKAISECREDLHTEKKNPFQKQAQVSKPDRQCTAQPIGILLLCKDLVEAINQLDLTTKDGLETAKRLFIQQSRAQTIEDIKNAIAELPLNNPEERSKSIEDIEDLFGALREYNFQLQEHPKVEITAWGDIEASPREWLIPQWLPHKHSDDVYWRGWCRQVLANTAGRLSNCLWIPQCVSRPRL